MAPCAGAHPSPEALRASAAERAQCAEDPAKASPVDRARFGMTEYELRAAVGTLKASAAALDGGAARGTPVRFERDADGPLARVEYDLWGGQVYAIRWQLATRFERPVLEELMRRAKLCLGPPDYDQTFEAEAGSAAATLRRIGWTHGEIQIELRQLHPLRGGPVYLRAQSLDRVRAMGEAGVLPLPEPDRSGPWWQRSMRPPEPAAADEVERLGSEFIELLAQVDH